MQARGKIMQVRGAHRRNENGCSCPAIGYYYSCRLNHPP